MIDDNFIQAAIKIRRKYLKLSNNMEFYKRKAQDVINNLEEVINKIEKIQDEAEKTKSTTNESVVLKLTKILKEVEEEGRAVEMLIDPLNEEIEKLAIEEQELWRNIKNKYPNEEEDQIVEYVKNRLIQENLS